MSYYGCNFNQLSCYKDNISCKKIGENFLLDTPASKFKYNASFKR